MVDKQFFADRADALEGLRTTTGLAIFDLDRTLLAGSSLIALGRALAGSGVVPRRHLATGALRDARFRRRGVADRDVASLKTTALHMVAGRQAEPLAALAREVGAELAASLRPAARFLVDQHLRAGDFCVVLSASPQELVEAVALGLGVHRAIGTVGAVADGRYTGAVEGAFCYGPGKLERLREVLGELDLSTAFAYADSASDLPLLSICGHPVAVSPDRRLRAVAIERGWPILSLS